MQSVPVILSVLLMGLLPAGPKTLSVQNAATVIAIAPPRVADVDRFPSASLTQTLSASGVEIMDLQSGQAMFEHAADVRRPVGSLTKIMTAIVIAESHAMDEVVEIPNDIRSTDGSVVHLPPGKHFTVGDLLSAMLIASANDAAETLAVFHSGTEAAFVDEMNKRAMMLGLTNTTFRNPSGLDHPEQLSTAREMAVLASYALKNPYIRERMSTGAASIRSEEGVTITLEHTHELLGKDSVIAGKTGTTDAAKQCLLSLVSEHGREYLVVLLRSNKRYVDMRMLLHALSALFI